MTSHGTRLIYRRDFSNSGNERKFYRGEAVSSCEDIQDTEKYPTYATRQLRKRASSTSLSSGLCTCENRSESAIGMTTDDCVPVQQQRRRLSFSSSSSLEQDSETKATPSSSMILSFLNAFINKRPRSPSSNSDSSSSGSSGCCSPCQEEIVVPIQACTESASQKFLARIRHKTTDKRWNVSALGEGARVAVSYDDGRYDLYAWRVGGNTFVFGYQDASNTYYVTAQSTGYLRLSKNGGDPFSISDPSSDYRCMEYAYSNSTGGYHLQPSHDTNLWIDYNDAGYAMVHSSATLAKTWSLSET